MPSWGVHLAVAKKILEEVKIDEKNDFIFGNILPDVQNGYVIKGVSNIVNHKTSHFDDFPKGVFGCHKKFLEVYGNSVFNDTMKLAYYTHLFTDDIWNREFYQNKVMSNNGEIEGIKTNDGKIIKGIHDDIRKLKHSDFGNFSKYLVATGNKIVPYYDMKLIDKSNSIDIVDINKNDFDKIFEYFDSKTDDLNVESIKKDFKILTVQEAENIFNLCAEEIINDLKKYKRM